MFKPSLLQVEHPYSRQKNKNKNMRLFKSRSMWVYPILLIPQTHTKTGHCKQWDHIAITQVLWVWMHCWQSHNVGQSMPPTIGSPQMIDSSKMWGVGWSWN